MRSGSRSQQWVTTEEFEDAINALVMGLARVALATCSGHSDRERLATQLERDIDGCKVGGLQRIAVASVLDALAKSVRNNVVPNR